MLSGNKIQIANAQVSEGAEIIPTVTLVFDNHDGRKGTISCCGQKGDTIGDVLFEAIKQIFYSQDSSSYRKLKLLSCGANFAYKGGCNAHAHIKIGSSSHKRGGHHPTNFHMAIARAMVNCFQDLII